jgi:hypothetical protein
MRNRWWRWAAGVFAALVIVSVALPQTGDAAQVGGGSAMNGAGGNSKMMRRMMMMKKMRKRHAMMQGARTGTGTANGAGS